jgi:protein-tyrosine-phosphatase/DNA-binding transcriptional ArsR family regulator
VRLAAHPLRWRLMTELADSDYRVRELVTLVREPQNLVSYHLRLLRDGGLVTAIRSSFDGRDSYYHLDLDRCAAALADTGAGLHPSLRSTPTPEFESKLGASPPGSQKSGQVGVLFVCTGNSARSPMAEALLQHRAGGRVSAISAGTRPRPGLHPAVARVLHKEFGIDVGSRSPRALDTVTDRRFDYVITLCDKAREVCPELPGRPRRVHWSIPDPAAAGGTDRAEERAFQRTASDIDTRMRYLLPVLSNSLSKEKRP